MSCSVDEAVTEFCSAITGDDGIQKPVMWEKKNIEDTLKDKIVERIKTLKETPSYKNLKIKGFDASEMNANQLVRRIIAIFNDEECYTPGMCIALTLNSGKADAAIVVFSKSRPEIFTTAKESDIERAYWDMLLNESMCSLWRNKGHSDEYEEKKLQKKRESFRKDFSKIWFQPLAEVDVLYRHVLYGLAFEMAKPHLTWHVHHERIKLIPAAACIKIAVDLGEIEHLEKVFGERTHVDRPREERDPRYEICLSNAKEIVKRVIKVGDDGRCLKKEVDEKAREIKNFFALASN